QGVTETQSGSSSTSWLSAAGDPTTVWSTPPRRSIGTSSSGRSTKGNAGRLRRSTGSGRDSQRGGAFGRELARDPDEAGMREGNARDARAHRPVQRVSKRRVLVAAERAARDLLNRVDLLVHLSRKRRLDERADLRHAVE